MGTIYTILQSNINIVTSSRNTLRIGELCNMDIGIRGGKVESRTSTAGSIIVEVAKQIARCSHNLIVVYISKATLMLTSANSSNIYYIIVNNQNKQVEKHHTWKLPRFNQYTHTCNSVSDQNNK
jgi:hypothetical protein